MWRAEGDQTWYNEIRSHSNLDGKAPKGIMLNKQASSKSKFVFGWARVLSGITFLINLEQLCLDSNIESVRT